MTPTLALAAAALITPAALPAPILVRCVPAAKAQAPKPPSQTLLDAFGILRRERTDADALSKGALAVLRARGVRISDPNATRLLRTTASGGRAWVVPVADVTPLLGMRYFPCNPKLVRPPRAVLRRAVTRRRTARLRVRRRFVVPAAPVPFLGPGLLEPPPLTDGKPQEGLVVVAEGDAPAGGGGTYKQVIRGLAAPAVAPCAGPKRDLVSVSGMVPDGVGSVFLTSADGTAVKADVKDNAYAFLVPPAKRRELWAPRYVVWTGGDGTPHVRQVALGSVPARLCRALVSRQGFVGRVTPSPGPFAYGGSFAYGGPFLVPPLPAPLPRAVPVPKRP